jgi:uncharacterized protein (TIGR02147 family)
MSLYFHFFRKLFDKIFNCMEKDVFEYRDYKAYLKATIASKPKGGRGIRIGLARSLGCPVSHISQILNGSSHLSMEQAEGVNLFFGHSPVEASFFLLLLQFSRAGTPQLRKRLDGQIREFLDRNLALKERLDIKDSLSSEDQALYHSSWLYRAIHVMVSVEEFQTKEALSAYLGISLKRIGEILEFLVSIGLVVKKEGGRFGMGVVRMHLPHDSPMNAKSHVNWRLQAIRSLEKEDTQRDLHYSSVVSVSDSDATRIKSLLMRYIQEIKSIIKDSKEEGVHCLSMDFFEL